MFHACATRFDVMDNLKFFVKIFGTKQGLQKFKNIAESFFSF